MQCDFYVYILFLPDGCPHYVGKGRAGRLSRHKWTHPAVRVAESLTDEEALVIEAALIAAIGKTPNGPLVNRNDGGPGPITFTTEAREKMRQAALRNGAGKRNKGRKHSPEAIEKIRAASIARGARPPVRQRTLKPPKPPPLKPPKPPRDYAAIGRKISAALKGRKLSIEHRSKAVMNLIGAGSIWITNGTSTHRIHSDASIPDGWRRGRRCDIAD